MSEEQQQEQQEQQEREGEEEGNAPLNEEVVADEDLGALGVIPEKAEEEPKEEPKEEEKEEEEEPKKEEEDVEEPIDPNDPEFEERRTYLRRIAIFFKELSLYYRGNRMPKGSAKIKALAIFRLRGEELPCNATYSENGQTLTLLSRTGKLKDTISMQDYRPPTHEEQTAFDEKRLQIIRKAEKDYETAIDELRRIEKTKIRGDIKKAQRAVAIADRHLYRSRYPEKAIQPYDSVEVRQIDFDQPQDVHKISVFALQVATRKRQDVYAVPEKGEEKEEEEEEPVVKSKRPIIFAAQPLGEHDFLSSFYVHPFDYKGHTYTTAYQAIMATIASKFGDDEKAKEIRAIEDAADIELTWDKLTGVTHTAWNLQLESLIIKVNRVKFANGSDLAAKLLKTGDAQIAAIPPDNEMDRFQGIGLTQENPNSANPSKWKGKNVVGLALEQIREELATVAAAAVTEESKKPKRSLRRLVPLSATNAATNVATNVATKGLSAATNVATKGLSAATNVATKGLSAAANAVTKGLSAVVEDATVVASLVEKGASAVSNAAEAVTKAVSPPS